MEDRRSRASRPARVPGTIAVIVALAGVTLAGWLIWGGQPLPASARNLVPTGEAGRLAADPMAVADFESGLESYSYVRSWPDVKRLQFLNPIEISTYEENGAGAARVTVSSRRPEGKVIVAVVRMKNRDAAIAAADRLDEFQFEAGFERRYPEHKVRRLTEVLSTPDEVPERKPVARAHYVHGDLVVRLELHAKSNDDVLHRFGPLLAKQLSVLPADE